MDNNHAHASAGPSERDALQGANERLKHLLNDLNEFREKLKRTVDRVDYYTTDHEKELFVKIGQSFDFAQGEVEQLMAEFSQVDL